MSTIARAWHAAMLALAEALDLHARGDTPETVLDLLRHARELVEIIEDEINTDRERISDVDVARMAATELRMRIEVASATLVRLH